MKSENGVTLVALITIILVLITIMSVGIYSGINSYKVIDLQKYKSQMQLIQNEVDDLYEEYQSYSLKNEGKTIDDYIDEEINGLSSEEIEEKGNKNKIINSIVDVNSEEKYTTIIEKFEININNSDYYLYSLEDIEKIFNIENINISEEFIINFEKRLLFSVTPIKVISKNAEGIEEAIDIYCLYQFDEEQKVVEFNSSGNFEYNIYKEEYKQIVEITNTINIKNVEIDIDRDGKYEENINTRKDYCTKVLGLNTKKVTLEIIKDCNIQVTDVFDNKDENKIELYDIPILEKNMIPIIVIDKEQDKIQGKICSVDDPKWYNYYTDVINIEDELKEVINEEKTIFAVAINARTTNPSDTTNPSNTTYNNYYNVNVSDTVNTILEIPISTDNNNQLVRVWIPKNLREHVNNTYGTIYEEEDFKGTGMWVEAEWNGFKYVPANGN